MPSIPSIDVESLGYDILKKIDLNKFRPPVIVTETLTFDPEKGGDKITEIIDLMLNNS